MKLFFLLCAAGLAFGQTPLQLYLVTPCRVVDTRTTQGKTGAFGPPAIVANVERDFPILAGGCNIPAFAVAYQLNIAVVPPGPVGFLAAWPAGTPYAGTSTLNSGGSVTANAAVVQAGSGGAIAIIASDPTDLVIDINGYYVAAATPIGPASGGLPPFTGVAGYLTTNGTSAAWGNITTGGSGALDCVTTPGECDIVTALVPLKATANVFLGANDFSLVPWLAIPNGSPSATGAPCALGSIMYDLLYLYICVSTNTWMRAPLSAF